MHRQHHPSPPGSAPWGWRGSGPVLPSAPKKRTSGAQCLPLGAAPRRLERSGRADPIPAAALAPLLSVAALGGEHPGGLVNPWRPEVTARNYKVAPGSGSPIAASISPLELRRAPPASFTFRCRCFLTLIPSQPSAPSPPPSLPSSRRRVSYRKPLVPCCTPAPERGIKHRSSPSSRQRLHRRRRTAAKAALAASGGGAGESLPERRPMRPLRRAPAPLGRRKGPPTPPPTRPPGRNLKTTAKKGMKNKIKRRERRERGKAAGRAGKRSAASLFPLPGCSGMSRKTMPRARERPIRRGRAEAGAGPAQRRSQKGDSFVQLEPPESRAAPSAANWGQLGRASPALLPTRLWPQPQERTGGRGGGGKKGGGAKRGG